MNKKKVMDETKIKGWNSVKDSGIREDFSTGSKRDSRKGKGRFDLLPFYALQRLARVYENGAVKYGDNNWRLGQPCSRYLDSALRHLFKAASGWKDEDHLAQAMWNIAGIIETQKMIELNTAPKELDDLKAFTPSWEEGEVDGMVTVAIESLKPPVTSVSSPTPDHPDKK